ncbi:hypothetical protein GLOIN_2v1772906 [Rhizophagus irregularis DAOM 181602=DAOM 197198]|uniref:Uncharacterized protein n=1 Tax=Rhizophagus irregularis (strain DAOM 181602 / DAOM 197198 / MUCL 43194) TaxID=747089 RepID=A0A2P4Q665_RHIID|nr:hypothetical protein GLOIN_2v1772906 [Rhizophagus irregularis DAOM 181602=DAOM 197198]POG73133.1 hypothetical protein GLOIN_2v1772906 [Rhizophagus irregularis DAOM 181602=DAOM 197198]|eukprot:XP_025179999.1 hypothetical protein GLOIN_2v1772906 [Rhizophagus irregularis DAOM 181602=DAOM 197198]
MVQKNHGPCSVQNCNNQVTRFNQFTSLAYEKAQKKGKYEAHTYLRIGQQLCHSHYMSIVEPYHTQKSEVPFFLEPDKENSNQSKSYSFAEQVTMLTKVLYEQRGNLELNPTYFKQMIEKADPHLQGLFDKLVKALVPDNRSAYNKVKARKTIMSLCYIMAGMRNKFVNDFKLEVGLHLSASGANTCCN